ncbi:hypothetical protein ACOME3_003070 [Neoechinorhynchus agilis]
MILLSFSLVINLTFGLKCLHVEEEIRCPLIEEAKSIMNLSIKVSIFYAKCDIASYESCDENSTVCAILAEQSNCRMELVIKFAGCYPLKGAVNIHNKRCILQSPINCFCSSDSCTEHYELIEQSNTRKDYLKPFIFITLLLVVGSIGCVSILRCRRRRNYDGLVVHESSDICHLRFLSQIKLVPSEEFSAWLCISTLRPSSFMMAKLFDKNRRLAWANELELIRSITPNNLVASLIAVSNGIFDRQNCSIAFLHYVILTEYSSIGSVYDFLQTDEMCTIKTLLSMALSLMSALDYLHSPNPSELVHLNVTSKNLIIKHRNGQCFIQNFSSAFIVSDQFELLSSGLSKNTSDLRYMAPEHF